MNALLVALAALSAVPVKPATAPAHFVVASRAELLRAVRRIGPPGATIVLRPGVYRLTEPLLIRRCHVNLMGSGWSTVLQRVGHGDALVFEDAAFCTVRDVLIAGDPAAKHGNGIVFRGQCGSCTVDFCRISGFPESGILYEGDPVRPQSSNTVSRCHLIDNGGDQIRSMHNNDFFIVQNQFGAHTRTGANAPRSGCALQPSSAGSYSMNYHWGNTVALRVGPGSHFNRFENNRFEESREAGVVMGENGGAPGYRNIFTGNTFHTSSHERSGAWPAVQAFGACDTTFTSNQVFSWDSATLRHSHSLVLGCGCSGWIVTSNIFRHNTGPAVVWDQKAGHIVKDNLGE